MTSQENSKLFAVNWDNHMNHVKRAFDNLFCSNELTDVTLYAEGRKIGAHKMLLSACSVYFQNIFRDVPQDHPIVILKGVQFNVLTHILKFIYNGEVSVDSQLFDTFLRTAEFLQISGLTESEKKSATNENDCNEITEELQDESVESTLKRPLKSEYIEIEHGQLKKVKESEYDMEEKPELHNNSKITQPKISQDSLDSSSKKMLSSKEDSSDRNKGIYECEICGKIYRLKDSLYKHSSVHAGNTTCTICSKVLSRKTHLGRHMLMTHGVVLPGGKNNGGHQ